MIQLISSVIKGSENRGMAVDIRFNEQDSHQPVVIFTHGFKGFKDWGHFPKVGEELAKAGFAFISFNFSHNGTTVEHPSDLVDIEAFGNNNYNKELFDIKQVIDGVSTGTLFSNLDINRKKIFLFGHSRGGGISVVKASEDSRIKGLVTWAALGDLQRTQADFEQWKGDGVIFIPNARTNQQMPMYYQFAEDYFANEERYSIKKCCKNMSVPALFIHGTNDATVPFSYAQKMEEWCASAKSLLIENGDHSFGAKHPFLEKQLPTHSKISVAATIAHLAAI